MKNKKDIQQMVYHTSQEQYQTPLHLTSELIKYHVDHTSISACPVQTRTKTQQLSVFGVL